jgi:hypothetical protein
MSMILNTNTWWCFAPTDLDLFFWFLMQMNSIHIDKHCNFNNFFTHRQAPRLQQNFQHIDKHRDFNKLIHTSTSTANSTIFLTH